MPIWKLSPIPTSASDSAWAFTRWFSPIVVRAANPELARRMAAEAFRKTESAVIQRDLTELISPWLDDGLVACRRVPVSSYRPDGPEQILRPHVTEYNRTG
jgi:hypothetical protein